MVRLFRSWPFCKFLSLLVLTTLLVFCLLFDPLISSFTWFRFQKNRLQKDVHRKIAAGELREHLVLLKFTKDEAQTQLKWLSSQEFEYNHQLYDVVESTIVGDSVLYWCWPDHEEMQIKAKIKEIIKLAFSSNSKKKVKALASFPAQLIPFLKVLWATLASPRNLPLPTWCLEKYKSSLAIYNSLTFPPPTPPPQLFL